jgi:hypothetical protein
MDLVDEIAVIAWDGPEPPNYPRFPISKGLNGAAVAAALRAAASNPARRRVVELGLFYVGSSN